LSLDPALAPATVRHSAICAGAAADQVSSWSLAGLTTVAGHKIWLQAMLIVLGTFVLEDAATVLAAMQAQSGAVPLPVALLALYAGIILGDLGLYGLGALSGQVPMVTRWVPPNRMRHSGRPAANLHRMWLPARQPAEVRACRGGRDAGLDLVVVQRVAEGRGVAGGASRRLALGRRRRLRSRHHTGGPHRGAHTGG